VGVDGPANHVPVLRLTPLFGGTSAPPPTDERLQHLQQFGQRAKERPTFQIILAREYSEAEIKALWADVPIDHFTRKLMRSAVTKIDAPQHGENEDVALFSAQAMAQALELGEYIDTAGLKEFGQFLPRTRKAADGFLRLIYANNAFARNKLFQLNHPELHVKFVDPQQVMFHGHRLLDVAPKAAEVDAFRASTATGIPPGGEEVAQRLPERTQAILRKYDQVMVGNSPMKDLLWATALRPMTVARVPGLGVSQTPSSASRAFLGPSGSGKTTSALAYAEMLQSSRPGLGEGIFQLDALYLTSMWVAHHERVTESLEPLAGNIIILEHAEQLITGKGISGNDSGQLAAQAIDAFMRAHPDTVLLITGEEDGTKEALRKVPSLAARYLGPAAPPVYSTKLTDQEIRALVDRRLAELRVRASPNVAAALASEIARHRGSLNFANGDTVNGRTQAAVELATQRVNMTDPTGTEPVTLEMDDVVASPRQRAEALDRAHSRMKELLGLEPVHKWLAMVEATAGANARRLKRGEPVIGQGYSTLLLGRPGTGKTVSVEALADILFATNAVSECKPPLKINAADNPSLEEFKKSLETSFGGVLFIDEIYMLSDENLQFLMKYLEDPDVHRNHVIVGAGYADKVLERMKRVNPGMLGRWIHQIPYEDVKDTALRLALEAKASAVGFSFAPDALDEAVRLISGARDEEDFANYRQMERLLDVVGEAHCLRRFLEATAQGISVETLDDDEHDPAGANLLLKEDVVEGVRYASQAAQYAQQS
jgi:DNA polymerase III delta prime subunit